MGKLGSFRRSVLLSRLSESDRHEMGLQSCRTMVYQRSSEIESRLADLLNLIQSGRYSTPRLASALSVSKPTVSRCISALRDRGYYIRAVKSPEGWAYELCAEPSSASLVGGQ